MNKNIFGKRGITFKRSSSLTLIEVEKEVALFRGYSWRTLGDFGKKKMENLLYLQNIGKGADVKFNYV